MKKLLLALVLGTFLISGDLVHAVTYPSSQYQFGTTNGFSIEGTQTSANTFQGTFEDGVNDPVNYTMVKTDEGRIEITTDKGTTTCEAGLCVGPNSDAFQGAMDSINNIQTPKESGQKTDNSTNNILGEKNSDLRTGNVDMSTIPKIIISVINVLLGVAGTVAVVALIYYAVQMQINSGITGDSSGVDKAKKGMTGALIGFVVAILAWFIVIRFVEILSSVS